MEVGETSKSVDSSLSASELSSSSTEEEEKLQEEEEEEEEGESSGSGIGGSSSSKKKNGVENARVAAAAAAVAAAVQQQQERQQQQQQKRMLQPRDEAAALQNALEQQQREEEKLYIEQMETMSPLRWRKKTGDGVREVSTTHSPYTESQETCRVAAAGASRSWGDISTPHGHDEESMPIHKDDEENRKKRQSDTIIIDDKRPSKRKEEDEEEGERRRGGERERGQVGVVKGGGEGEEREREEGGEGGLKTTIYPSPSSYLAAAENKLPRRRRSPPPPFAGGGSGRGDGGGGDYVPRPKRTLSPIPRPRLLGTTSSSSSSGSSNSSSTGTPIIASEKHVFDDVTASVIKKGFSRDSTGEFLTEEEEAAAAANEGKLRDHRGDGVVFSPSLGGAASSSSSPPASPFLSVKQRTYDEDTCNNDGATSSCGSNTSTRSGGGTTTSTSTTTTSTASGSTSSTSTTAGLGRGQEGAEGGGIRYIRGRRRSSSTGEPRSPEHQPPQQQHPQREACFDDIIVRPFEPQDAAAVRRLCYRHFRSLTLPSVFFWICHHSVDAAALFCISLFFLPIRGVLLSAVCFFIYLLLRGVYEFELYIKRDCPDLDDIYQSYMRSRASGFWVAERLEARPPQRKKHYFNFMIAPTTTTSSSSSSKTNHSRTTGDTTNKNNKSSPGSNSDTTDTTITTNTSTGAGGGGGGEEKEGEESSASTPSLNTVRLVVDRSQRRQHIGTLLLNTLIAYALQQHYSIIRLYTNNLNSDSIRFAKTKGFELQQIVRRGLMRGDLLKWQKTLELPGMTQRKTRTPHLASSVLD